MATTSTYNTILSYILCYVDGDISLKNIQKLIDYDLEHGECYVKNKQLITLRYDDKSLSEKTVLKIINAYKEEVESLRNNICRFKRVAQHVEKLKDTLNKEGVNCAEGLIKANGNIRFLTTKKIMKINKKIDFLQKDLRTYTTLLCTQVKF